MVSAASQLTILPSLHSFAASPIVKIIVSPAKYEYAVHKKLLVRDSGFFKDVLAPGTKESESNTVTIPDGNAYIFPYLVNWVYIRATDEDFPEKFDFYEGDLHPKNTWELMQAWILGDMLRMPKWQNHLIFQLSRRFRDEPVAPHELKAIFPKISNESKLYEFLVDQFAKNLQDEAYVGVDKYTDWDTMKFNPSLVSKAIDAAMMMGMEGREEEPADNWENYYVK